MPLTMDEQRVGITDWWMQIGRFRKPLLRPGSLHEGAGAGVVSPILGRSTQSAHMPDDLLECRDGQTTPQGHWQSYALPDFDQGTCIVKVREESIGKYAVLLHEVDFEGIRGDLDCASRLVPEVHFYLPSPKGRRYEICCPPVVEVQKLLAELRCRGYQVQWDPAHCLSVTVKSGRLHLMAPVFLGGSGTGFGLGFANAAEGGALALRTRGMSHPTHPGSAAFMQKCLLVREPLQEKGRK